MSGYTTLYRHEMLENRVAELEKKLEAAEQALRSDVLFGWCETPRLTRPWIVEKAEVSVTACDFCGAAGACRMSIPSAIPGWENEHIPAFMAWGHPYTGNVCPKCLPTQLRNALAHAEEVAGTRAITATQDSTTTVEQSPTDEHMCPNCFSCNSSLVMTLSGKTSGHCRTCGHDWTSQEASDDLTSE